MVSTHQLAEIPLLASLSEDERVKLAGLMKERRVPKGSYIVYEQDSAPSIMFLAKGRAKVTLVSDDDKEIILYNYCKGDVFGELAVLTGADRSANVVASTECRLYSLGAKEFIRHIHENCGFALALMTELAQRLQAASAKIADLALYDVYRRVARTLKSMATATEVNGEEVFMIDERPTHSELSKMVGTSREMVTRALKGLEEDGCIVVDDQSIEVRKLPV